MINWSDRGGAFVSANELESVLSHLKKMGLLGQNSVLVEGFGENEEDASLSLSELSWSEATTSTEDVMDWIEVMYEIDSISPSGFLYPLTGAQISNLNSGYKNAIKDQKAGEYFISIVKEVIQEALYEFGSKYGTGSFVFRIPLEGITIIEASGALDGNNNNHDAPYGEGYMMAGTLTWFVEIDSNSIYKEVVE